MKFCCESCTIDLFMQHSSYMSCSVNWGSTVSNIDNKLSRDSCCELDLIVYLGQGPRIGREGLT